MFYNAIKMPASTSDWENFQIKYRNYKKAPVTITMLEDEIIIKAHIKFTKSMLKPYHSVNPNIKDKNLNQMKEGYTFADGVCDGISEYWGKTYQLSGREKPIKVRVQIIRFDDPSSVYEKGQRFFLVKHTRLTGTSFVMSAPWRWLWGLPFYLSPESFMLNWSPYATGSINMNYYKYLSSFKKTAAHEFGHILGIGDAYAAHYRFYYEAPNTMAYMMNNNISVNSNELMMVLRAHSTGRMQYFPIKINPKHYFNESFKNIKWIFKRLKNSHKTNH